MTLEEEIRAAIEFMRKRPVPTPSIELTPEQFEALRKLPVKTIPMDAANQIFCIPFTVKDGTGDLPIATSKSPTERM